MHYDDEYVLNNNEFSFVCYKHGGCDDSDSKIEITSIRSAYLISEYNLKELLFSLKYTLPTKKEYKKIQEECFYLCIIKITDVYDLDYDVISIEDVSNNSDQSFQLH